jgi:O-antigen ligase
MTETIIVLATTFAGFLLIDPFFGGALTKATIAKWPLIALGFGSLAFHLVGRALTDPRRLRLAISEVLHDWWPIIVLAVFITAGSAYARFADNIRESFLGMGLGMFFLPLMAVAVRSSRHPVGFMQGLAAAHVLTVLGMMVVLFADLHVFHEEIFVAVPLGAYLLVARPVKLWRLLLGLVIMFACLVSFKNTTFLILLAVLACCGLVWIQRLLRRHNRMGVVAAVYFLLPVLLLGVAALFWLWWTNRTELPSGNVQYRTEMYGIAWRRFLDSPLWGTGFTDSSVVYFELYRVATRVQTLPTHSDILDLLAHGGLIAFTLWGLTVWRLFSISMAAARQLASAPAGDPNRSWRWLFVLGLVQLGALITYAVNPPMINPVHAYWMWGAAGVMWALYRQLVAPLAAPAPVQHLVPRHLQMSRWALLRAGWGWLLAAARRRKAA